MWNEAFHIKTRNEAENEKKNNHWISNRTGTVRLIYQQEPPKLPKTIEKSVGIFSFFVDASKWKKKKFLEGSLFPLELLVFRWNTRSFFYAIVNFIFIPTIFFSQVFKSSDGCSMFRYILLLFSKSSQDLHGWYMHLFKWEWANNQKSDSIRKGNSNPTVNCAPEFG